MRIVYNRFLPPKGFSAMAFFGIILARRECKPLSERTINHEAIHAAQAKDCGGWVPFYLRYLFRWIRFGYRNCPFEREAYDNGDNLDYLSNRKRFEWEKYLKDKTV
jgi:hypothetical protein